MTDQTATRALAAFLVGRTLRLRLVDALDLTGFYVILAGMWLAGGQLRMTATKMYEAAALGFDRARPLRRK